MTAPTPASRAVFLSYASQDAEAARRICEALRGAGVEVWFDVEGGLEHGDEWDAKIRRQIKDCVLFLPLISANTQARHEGYFRIEWELAAERAMGIASGVAFILPVVIDDTREPAALVPDRFRKVQWTRLPGGSVPPDVLQRFLKLWSLRTGLGSQEESRAVPAAGNAAPVPVAARRTPYVPIAAVVLALAGAVGWWLARSNAPRPAPAAATPTLAVEPKSALTPAPPPAATPAANDKSLIVLPLENLSPDPANAFFTDGMHAEIISALQAVPELKVLSRESALALRAAGGSVRELARQAGVAHVLSGSVRRDGTKVRVLLDLRRASDEAILWSAPKATRELKDTFALQAEVAEEVARVLRARFDKGAFAGLRFLTTDPRAYDAYLKSHEQYYQNLNLPTSILKAVALMEEGMTFDAKFMPGARLLGRMYVRLYIIAADVEKRERYADEAKRWSELASTLVPGGAGDTALAYYYFAVEEDPMRSLSYAENTVRALPNDFEGHYYVGLALRALGRWSEALPHFEHSMTLDPVNLAGWNALLETLVYLRRNDRFHSSLEKLAATSPGKQTEFFVDRLRFLTEGYLPPTLPGSAGTFARLMWLWRSRRFEELVEATRTALRVNAPANSNTFERLTWQCDALRRLGREAEAEEAARELAQIVEQMNATPQRDRTSKLRRSAMSAVRLGQVDEAITAAQRAIAACEGPTVARRWQQELLLAETYAYIGRAKESVPLIEKLLAVPSGLTVPRLKLDPIWDKIRDDPGFKALLADPKNSAPL